MPPRRRITSGEVTRNRAFAASTCATVIFRLTANPPASDYTGYVLGRLPASAGPQPAIPIERRTGPCAFYHGPCATLRGIKRCAGPRASSHGVGRGPHEAWHRRLLRDAMRHIYIYLPHLVGQGSCLPPHHLSGTLAHAAAGCASRTCRRILSQRRCGGAALAAALGAARARACRHAGRWPGAIATTRVVPQASLNRRAPRGRRHSRVRSGPRPLAPHVVQVALRLWVEH